MSPINIKPTAKAADDTLSSVVRVAHNSLWNMGGWIGASLLSFIATPLLISLLGRDHYGLMVLLVTILAPLGLLDFGIGEATIKYVAESIARKDYLQTGKYIQSTFMFNLSVGILGGAAIVLLARVLSTSVFRIPAESQALARHCLYWIGTMWCVTQIRQTFIGVVTALQRYEILNAGTLLSQVATLVAGLGVLFLGGNLLDLVRAQTIAAALVGISWLVVCRRLLPGISLTPSFDLASFRKTFGFGFWQMLNNVGGILAHQSERWLLAVLLPIAALGFYNVAFQSVALVYLVAYKMGQVLFPAVSHMQGQGRDEEAVRLVIQANWFLSTMAISGFVSLVVFAHDFLSLWVGAEFAANTTNIVRILALGSAATCLFAVPNFYLLGIGKAKWLTALSFMQGIVTLAVAALLIPHLGLAGAGWGATASSVVHIIFLVLLWKRIFRVWIPGKVFFSATFGQYVIGIILGGGFLLARNAMTWRPNWIVLGAAGLGCAALSATIIFAIDGILPGGLERRRLASRLIITLIPALSRFKSQPRLVT